MTPRKGRKPDPNENNNQAAPQGAADASEKSSGTSIPIDGPETSEEVVEELEAAVAEAEAAVASDEEAQADLIEEAERIVEDSKAAKKAEESEAIAKAKAEVADWKDKYMRLHAEWDTYRRRTNEQREAEKKRAAEKLVEGLIPVLDDFERTIDYANQNGENGLLGGVQAVYAKLTDVLARDGVETIDPAGEPFNALEQQAVATVDDPSVPDETVAQVYQKGYRLGTKVLRPAMVTVTTGGPKREVEAEE